MAIEAELFARVRERAGHACEYCLMPQAFYPTVPFPIDHIIARQHGGETSLDNLALSCLHDNAHKGPNIAGLDPRTGRISRLFHPRKDRWKRHFEWREVYVEGRTAIGRTTVVVLAMNHPDVLAVRESLFAEGKFPSRESKS